MRYLRPIRLFALTWILLLAQQAGLLHVCRHLPTLHTAAMQSEIRLPTSVPAEEAELACPLCTSFCGSHGAPPMLSMQAFASSDASILASFAVLPAPTFARWSFFAPRAPPVLPV